jgi:hypothetical protein
MWSGVWCAAEDGRNPTQPARLVVLECLAQLVPGVHHERPVAGDGFADGTAAEEQRSFVLPERS